MGKVKNMAVLATSEHSELQELLYNWVKWLSTRKYYAKALPLSVLASLQIERSPSLGEPDADNNALCCAFNMVISIADDIDRLPFLYVYLKESRPKPIKTLAFDLGVDRDTIYYRAHNAGAKFLYQAKKLQQLNASMRNEIKGYAEDFTAN